MKRPCVSSASRRAWTAVLVLSLVTYVASSYAFSTFIHEALRLAAKWGRGEVPL